MQTFSGMQRNSTNIRTLTHDLLWLVPLVIYEALGTIYFLMPPLFGFMVALLVINKRKRYLPLVLLYLLFYEADHGFFICSSWFFLFIFFRFALPIIEDYIVSRSFTVFLTITACYIGYFLFVLLINFIFGLATPQWSWLLMYYVLIESLLAWIFLCV